MYMDRAALMCNKLLEAVFNHPSKNKVLVIAGDMLDGTDPTEQERNLMLSFVIRALTKKVYVVMITGNHEFDSEDGSTMLDGFNVIQKLNSKYLHVTTHEPAVVDIDEYGVSFLCIPCQQNLTSKKLRTMLAELQTKAGHDLCYGVVHEALNGSIGDNNQPLRSKCDAPKMAGTIQGILLGDIHVQQKMGEGVWYAGSPYQTKINESHKKGLLVWVPGKKNPDVIRLKGVPRLIRVSDPRELKKYEGTKHSVKYVGRERVETEAPNITIQPNLKVIEESGEVKHLVEESRHSALLGLREALKASGLSDDEIEYGYSEAENALR